jgi:hypothetical protein
MAIEGLDDEKCKKCGGPLSVLRTSRKAPYIGCKACKGIEAAPAPKLDDPPAPEPMPEPQPKKRWTWGTILHGEM